MVVRCPLAILLGECRRSYLHVVKGLIAGGGFSSLSCVVTQLRVVLKKRLLLVTLTDVLTTRVEVIIRISGLPLFKLTTLYAGCLSHEPSLMVLAPTSLL